ncbi:phosphatase PAP2 family protein [Chryseobacterium sp. PBS4-4]|uniref:Phosphatase PAP2 family protein n=1 Tax=Chryseobacterium edaphi TaxID=2976532 RepID=A0ABT2W5D1_9FLAO|nr:phosphatase PAP2 family protein [Chryseobacterium edaphi]MCU7617198.1 phosphatase PAP2 family protein [Chryseobacterium edaphi]
MRNRLFGFLICVVSSSFCKAQDSLSLDTNSQSSVQEAKANLQTSFFRREWVKKSTAPVLFFTASAATWGERKNIREIRNRYIPTFKVGYDNYLQYAPTAAVYGLKLAGVKGRNNIGRATLSYAASIGIMGLLVNSLKYTAKVERPDGSSKNSFPSGHTSMAFTNASFLHKEYGLVNSAYSIGGYSAAAITGLGRNLNNRHWISDVLAGAGIGIISTELGYFFIDKIYKNKGDNLGMLAGIEGNGNPSFLSLKLGTALSTTNFLKESELSDKKEVGFETGIEGAYFFSKNWGIGGDFSFSSFPVKPVEFPLDEELGNFDVTTESLGFLNFGIGPYYSHEFSEKLQLTLKATAGYSSPASGKVIVKSELFDLPNNEFQVAEYKPSSSFRWNSGAALTYKFNPELGITLYADYNQTQSTITYHFNEILQNDDDLSDDLNDDYAKEKINYVSIGLKLSAYF